MEGEERGRRARASVERESELIWKEVRRKVTRLEAAQQEQQQSARVLLPLVSDRTTTAAAGQAESQLAEPERPRGR